MPAAISTVLTNAFSPTAAAGGFLGATVMMAMLMVLPVGVSLTNPVLAVPIVAAAAKTNGPPNRADFYDRYFY